MKETIDHEVIKKWILKWGGEPAVGAGSEDQSGQGILRVNFLKKDTKDSSLPIGWEEFFDIFEADRLVFRYNDKVAKGNEILSFNFSDRDKTAPAKDDETTLPEMSKMAEENMFNNFDLNQSN